MLIPALFYVFINFGDSETLKGWAIPSATDIAFSLGVLSLLGKRVPLSLKVFLTALAIIDDLGAIVIIALFYSGNLSIKYLLLMLAAFIILLLINRFNIKKFFFFKLKEVEGNKANIFSKNDIDLFIKKHSFTFYAEDKICYFKKKN